MQGLRRLTAWLAALALVSGASLAFGTSGGEAHRHSCHRARTCPSDHASYRWRGLLCVKPSSPARTPAFRTLYVYATYVYYCKR